MIQAIRTFRADEDGAVTVDWVVLTAAIGFLSVTVIGYVWDASLDTSSGIGAAVTKQQSLLDP